jgi:hypothetical protein
LKNPARIHSGENAEINTRSQHNQRTLTDRNRCEDSDGKYCLNFSPARALLLHEYKASAWTAVSLCHPEYPGKQQLQCQDRFNFSRTRANTLILQDVLLYVI